MVVPVVVPVENLVAQVEVLRARTVELLLVQVQDILVQQDLDNKDSQGVLVREVVLVEQQVAVEVHHKQV